MKIYSKKDIIVVLDNVKVIKKSAIYSKVFVIEVCYEKETLNLTMHYNNEQERDDTFDDMLKIMKKWT